MKKLKEQRLKKGFTQSSLAAVSGVPLHLVQSYEQGIRHIDGAKLDTLCSLALALDVQVEDILESTTLREKLKATLKK